MDGKVLLEAVEALVKIKKVDRNMVFDALEMVLLTAYKKESGSNAKASVSLNRETGEYKIYEEKTNNIFIKEFGSVALSLALTIRRVVPLPFAVLADVTPFKVSLDFTFPIPVR